MITDGFWKDPFGVGLDSLIPLALGKVPGAPPILSLGRTLYEIDEESPQR